MSGSLYASFLNQATEMLHPFNIGIPVFESPWLPYRQRFKACDVETREEFYLEGDLIHAVYVPEIIPEPAIGIMVPKRRMEGKAPLTQEQVSLIKKAFYGSK